MGYLTKEQIKEFEGKKAGFEKRKKQGIKFPMRTDPNKTKQLAFVRFSLLEKEIGFEAMDDIEKAAYLYHTHHDKDGEHRIWDWEFYCNERAIKYYKACIDILEKFDNNQAYEAEKTGRQKAEKTIKEVKEDVATGKKIKKAASDGGKARSAKYPSREQYQLKIDKLHKENKYLSYTECCKRVAKKFGVSSRTVQSHTKNFKK